MRLISIYTAIVLWIMATGFAQAQETDQENNPSVENLIALKAQIVQQEKDSLKSEVENINSQLQNNVISSEEAETLKMKAAEMHALNIENRLAIIDNKIALLERNGDNSLNENGHISISVGNEDADNQRIFGVSIKSKKRDVVHDKRTTSGAVVAFGLNNVITEGESLEDSDFEIWGSRFFEIGWVWNTRVLKNSNWVRFKYGLSFQYNGIKPTDNRYFVDTGEETELQTYPLNLKDRKSVV